MYFDWLFQKVANSLQNPAHNAQITTKEEDDEKRRLWRKTKSSVNSNSFMLLDKQQIRVSLDLSLKTQNKPHFFIRLISLSNCP